MNRHIAAAAITLVTLLVGSAEAQNWVDISPTSGPEPTARAWSSAVLDSQNRRMIIFAGRNGAGDQFDIWSFDLSSETWTEITPSTGSAPSKRRTPASIYDPVGHRMVTWSGQGPGGFLNDVWEFDLTSGLWKKFSPIGGPPNIRYGVAAAFDPVAGELVTFAGFTSSGRFDDTWRFNPPDSSWTNVSPVTSPLERCLHSASYDSQKHRLIMYGGQNSGARDDIWAFDYATNTWTEFTPPSKPAGRWFSVHVYDSANNRVTIFGGNTNPVYSNEVHVFDLWTEEWTQLSPTGGPPAGREGAAGVYDAVADRMVFFGGKSTVYYNGVWALENLSGTVTSARPRALQGATLNQNIPNPFNPSTSIVFAIRSPGDVVLRIYDINGRLVRTLVDKRFEAGEHTAVWNGRDTLGRPVASGVYFYRIETGTESLSRRMVLLK